MVCFAPIYSRPISIGMKATIQHGHPRMPSITQVEADYEEDGIMVDIHRYTGIVMVYIYDTDENCIKTTMGNIVRNGNIIVDVTDLVAGKYTFSVVLSNATYEGLFQLE